MTRSEYRYRDRRREIERELEDVSAPAPPADLLDAIRSEIPADLVTASDPDGEQPAGATSHAWWRSRSFRIAAALAFVAFGAAVMLRLSDGSYRRIEDRGGVSLETRPVAPASAASAEVEVPDGDDAGVEPLQLEAPAPELSEAEPQARLQAVEQNDGDAESLRALGYVAGRSEGRGVVAESAPVESGGSRGDADGSKDVRSGQVEDRPTGLAPAPAPVSAAVANGVPGGVAGGVPGGVPGGVAGGATVADELRRADPVQEAAGEKITISSEAPMVDKFNSAATAAAGNESKAQQGKEAARDQVAEESVDETIVVTRGRARNARRTRKADVPAAPPRQAVAVDLDVLPVPEVPPSTGGTDEPNDAPVGDMFFRAAGTNPFVDTREDAQSTFALDVDTGSWTLARSYLDRGTLPPPEAIRVEEFVNAQEYDDPAPRRGEFTLVAEGAPSPFAPEGEYRVLRFAVKGREIDAADRKPAILTFVVDVSGSMAEGNRLVLVQRALGMLLDELEPEDRVGLVVYGTNGRILLEHTSDHERIRRAIDSLRPEGSTNAEEGLRLGYDLAGGSYRSDWNNRIVLCSDGVANVGLTGPESILERIGREARRGIELTTVGVGMGNYNDVLMEQLADKGDGRYHYVDTLEEAHRIFRENLTGTLETIAKDAKVQVEFDPSTVERWRLLGYENRDVADRDFRNDRIDAGEIGAGHSATAVYEVRLAPRAARTRTVGTLRLRWHSVASGKVEEAALTLRVSDLDPSFADASRNLRRAAVTAELAEILKHSFYAREASWRTLRDEVDRLEGEPGSASRDDRAVLRDLVNRAAELSDKR